MTSIPIPTPSIRKPLLSVAIFPQLLQLALLLAVFANGIDIARSDRAQGVSLSPQVLARIALAIVSLGLGAWGWWRLETVRKIMMTARGWVFLLFVASQCISVPMSIEPKTAGFVAMAMMSYGLLVTSALVVLGIRRTILTIVVATYSYVVVSWLVYLLVPEIGIFKEYLTMTDSVQRMGGLGHPNTVGRSACHITLLLLICVRERWVSWRWLVLALPLLFATLIATKSRSPIAATAVGVVIFAWPLLRDRATYFLAAISVCLVAGGALFIESTQGIDFFLSRHVLKTTKSGDMQEITSLTGRTEIWEAAIGHIKASPWFGYGGGTSSNVMIDYSGHAHNIYLETALNHGIPTALLFVVLTLFTLKDALSGRIVVLPEMMAFILVLGMVESPIVGMPSDPLLCLWHCCIFLGPYQYLTQKSEGTANTPALNTARVVGPVHNK